MGTDDDEEKIKGNKINISSPWSTRTENVSSSTGGETSTLEEIGLDKIREDIEELQEEIEQITLEENKLSELKEDVNNLKERINKLESRDKSDKFYKWATILQKTNLVVIGVTPILMVIALLLLFEFYNVSNTGFLSKIGWAIVGLGLSQILWLHHNGKSIVKRIEELEEEINS